MSSAAELALKKKFALLQKKKVCSLASLALTCLRLVAAP
jgi:hypothetical protein